MRLYTSIGPNPKVVRMFMAERGIDIPKIELDLRGGETRQPEFLAKNPPANPPRWNSTMAPSSPRSPRSANTSTRSPPERP